MAISEFVSEAYNSTGDEMPFKIKVSGGKNEIMFLCEENETILEAAERSGYELPYSCRNGVCSTCEGILLSGDVTTCRERGERTIRYCMARPCSDIEIEPQRIQKSMIEAPKRNRVKVYSINQPANDVTILGLRLPIGKRCKFKAGQYLRICLDGGANRNYSFANPPQKNNVLELHIRHVPDGRFSDSVLSQLEKGSELEVESPYGQFGIGSKSDSPVIFVATGTGFAPIKSMIEDQIAKGETRQIEFYWGGRRRANLYLYDLAKSWAERLNWFDFKPVLSQSDKNWEGRTGWVQDAILADHPDLRGWEAYACGNPDMISSVREILVKKVGLSPNDFFCDPFVSTKEQD